MSEALSGEPTACANTQVKREQSTSGEKGQLWFGWMRQEPMSGWDWGLEFQGNVEAALQAKKKNLK